MRTLLLLLVLTGGACAEEPQLPERPRPNIVLVYSDDHATRAVGAYGSPFDCTPNLDRLAAEGMTFRNSFVTNSICGPCRAVVLTGKHSHLNGFHDNGDVFDGSQTTFPKLLQAAGYETAIVGKWHLKSEPTGFDHWQVLRGQGDYYNPRFRTPEGEVQIRGYTTEVITDLALDWLREERDGEKPFLLMMQHKAPHREWAPGPRELSMFEGETMPEPPTLFDDYSGRASPAANQQMEIARHMSPRDLKFVAPRNLDEEQLAAWNAAYGPRNEAFEAAGLEGEDLVRWRYQRYIKDYLRCIAGVDRSVGELMAYLDAAGLSENTVFIYSSDQGFYLGEHGWYDKRWMYEESLRTPLLVRWPGVVEPGAWDEHLVQNLDMAQTFLELAGVEDGRAHGMQGESLVPLLRGETPDWRDAIYYHYYEFPAVHMVAHHYGVRTATHKLIRYPATDEWEMFDLVEDPHELTSLHGSPDHALVQTMLEGHLQQLQERYGDDRPDESRDERRDRMAREAAKDAELTLELELGHWRPRDLPRPNPAYRPLTVGARVVPAEGDGVILAQGGASYGYLLGLDASLHPVFSVRDRDELFEVKAPEAVTAGESVHVAATLDAEGDLHLFVDGREVASKAARLISRMPADWLSVGADTGSFVGAVEGERPFAGEIQNLRIYTGLLPDDRIRQWAVGREVEPRAEEDERPNVIVIFTDDQGYADMSCQGADGFTTPNLDRIAAEGVRLTDFYVSQPVCGASRASLLTGCYANRVGIFGAPGPGARSGIHEDETTLAEVCRSAGYATGMFGKWHLGHHPRFLPVRHGFDEYLGLPYSNDMWPQSYLCKPITDGRKRNYPPLPLIEDEATVQIIEDAAGQDQLTTLTTERAVDFIRKHADDPFFLYVAHSMPHTPLGASHRFRGSSERGLYGDVIQEIDAGVGRILEELERQEIAGNTLVLYTSDNGPWINFGREHAGSTGGLREAKGTTFEGGVRVPFVARWPERIPAGHVSAEPVMTIDLLPTIAGLVGGPMPERSIDGKNIWPILAGEAGAKSPHEALFFYYHRNHLEAMRSGRWKLHFPHRYRTMKGRKPGEGGLPGSYDHRAEIGLSLFDLEADRGETTNVAAEHPEVMQRLQRLADEMRVDLGDRLTGVKPTGARQPGVLER